MKLEVVRQIFVNDEMVWWNERMHKYIRKGLDSTKKSYWWWSRILLREDREYPLHPPHIFLFMPFSQLANTSSALFTIPESSPMPIMELEPTEDGRSRNPKSDGEQTSSPSSTPLEFVKTTGKTITFLMKRGWDSMKEAGERIRDSEVGKWWGKWWSRSASRQQNKCRRWRIARLWRLLASLRRRVCKQWKRLHKRAVPRWRMSLLRYANPSRRGRRKFQPPNDNVIHLQL